MAHQARPPPRRNPPVSAVRHPPRTPPRTAGYAPALPYVVRPVADGANPPYDLIEVLGEARRDRKLAQTEFRCNLMPGNSTHKDRR